TVPAACSQVAPIRTEGDCPYFTPAGELEMAITTLHLPDSSGTVLTCRSQVTPVGAEYDCAYFPLVGQAAGNDFPRASAAILTCCCQVAPIRTERDITQVI